MSRHKAKLKAKRKRMKGRKPSTRCVGGYTCGCVDCAEDRKRAEFASMNQGLSASQPWEGDLDARDDLRARRMRHDGRGLVHGRAAA